MKGSIFAGLCLLFALGAFQVVRPADEAPTFASSVQPFFAANCTGCHNATAKIANLDLTAYNQPEHVLANHDQFERIVRRIAAGEMPPSGRPRPAADKQTAAIQWIENELRTSEPAGVLARRLNRTEYNNTVRDLLGVDIDAANDFPQDDALYGFDNIANALTVSPLLMEKYLAAAEKISRIAVFGPDNKPELVRYLQGGPRRFENANAKKITEPANFSMQKYDETGIQFPSAMHRIHKIPVDGEYNVIFYNLNGWPKGSDPHFLDFYVDGVKTATVEVPNVYTEASERVPFNYRVRVKLTAGEHYFIAALPKIYEGLPENYKGPNPSKIPVPQRPGGRGGAFAPAFDPPSVSEMSFEGPFNAVPGPTAESRARVFACAEKTDACSEQILRNIAARAFRHPVADASGIVKVAADARKRGRNFEQSIALAIQAILISPDFLFRVDGTSTEFDLASRLSYFLWSTMPDEELTRLAAAGTLHTPQVLELQVKRMLADPRSKALAKNFASQWLETRRLEAVSPDRDTFPDFNDYLRMSMAQETERFFDHIVREDRSVLDFLDAPYTFLNQRLAEHYGIEGVTGTNFRKVDLTGTQRGGILRQASVLTVSSYANRTSPVLRGKWVLENLLNTPPPPPPPDVPKLDEAKAGSAASMRAQMEAHRANAVCASCHSRMDPIGFALENFNGVGAYRAKDGEFVIDPAGVLPDGKKFGGVEGLIAIFKANPDQFTSALTEKLYIYALGRGVQSSDRAAIQQISAQSAKQNRTFSSLILGIVNSAPFQTGARGN